MRYGQNPLKAVEQVDPPSDVTVVVISYIPFLAGYYEESLNVLKYCLQSLTQTNEGQFDLMVFDNASCPEVRDFLSDEHEAGRIQMLFLSDRNLGKSGAWNVALSAAPGETIVYADSDVRFFPGWLDGHMDILNSFPNVGMLTGMPVLTNRESSKATFDWAKSSKIQSEAGQLISWEDHWRHVGTLGETEEEARKVYEQYSTTQLEINASKAFVGAEHFQFATRKSVLNQILPLPANRPMGRVNLLDQAVNELGYLRLNTPEWYVEHIGNSLAENAATKVISSTPRKSIWQTWLFRKILYRIYTLVFRLLFRR